MHTVTKLDPLRLRTSVHFSSASAEWSTPQAFFDELNRVFGGFTLDPCATPRTPNALGFSPAKMTASHRPGAARCS